MTLEAVLSRKGSDLEFKRRVDLNQARFGACALPLAVGSEAAHLSRATVRRCFPRLSGHATRQVT
jgi:hypothetical protein